MGKTKLTRAVVDALEPPVKGERLVRDTEVMGFGVRVSVTGSRAYFVEKKVAGKTRRITIGRTDLITLKAAREAAIESLGAMARGEVLPAIKPELEPVKPRDATTMQEVLDHYLAERQRTHPPMKASTAKNYRKLMAEFGPWLERPIGAMTQSDIVNLHAEMTERGPVHANNVMRVARSLFNHAIDNDAFCGPGGTNALIGNPTVVLNKRRLWNRETRRTRHLSAETLPTWWKMVEGLDPLDWPGRAEVTRDLWRFMLMTGMRYEEAGRVRVDLVDLDRATFTVTDTKNREDLELPASKYVLDLLTRRVQEAKRTGSPWVFPAPRREAGHASAGHDIRKVLTVATKLQWSPHDLRRTFASILETFDISDATIKRLMGHKQTDVTAGYIQQDMERLREIMQRYERRVLELAEAAPPRTSTARPKPSGSRSSRHA